MLMVSITYSVKEFQKVCLAYSGYEISTEAELHTQKYF